jgi:tetratricopeptide (TPR) repeat protein
LARAYLETGQHTLVEEVLPYALAEAQDSAQALVDVAALYESLHQTDRALSAYERAVELGYVDGAMYVRLGEIYQRRGMGDKAQALYAQAQQRMGDDPGILLALARQHLEGDATSREAAALLEKAIQLAPGDPEPCVLLARTYRAQDRMDAATKLYQRAVQLADADSALGREIRREVHRLDIAPAYQENHGWGETARSVSGLVLLPLFAALANARMSPLHISFASWVALLVASAGGYLLVSANEVTRNPGMCALFGEGGAKDRAQQMTVGLPGAALWFLALGAILLRV